MRKWLPLIVSAVALAAMCALIFNMSAQQASDSASLSLGLAQQLLSIFVPGYDQMSAADQLYWRKVLDHPLRKAAHFTEYAVLGALMLNLVLQAARTWRGEGGGLRVTRATFIVAWLLASLYAVTDELHQMFVDGRAGMVSDVLLDSCGVLTGAAILALALTLAQRGRRAK